MSRITFRAITPWQRLWAAGLLAAACGCANTAEPPRPEVALGNAPGELMPVAQANADLSLVADQTTVRVIEPPKISYDPLPSITELHPKPPKAAADRHARTARATTRPGPEAGQPAQASGHKRSRIGGLLSGMVRRISGGRGRAGTVAQAPAGRAPSTAKGAAVPLGTTGLTLVDAADENTSIPSSEAGYTTEQLEAVRAAAEKEAVQLLAAGLLALPLDAKTTFAQATKADAEELAAKLEGHVIVGTAWTDEVTLEVRVQLPIERLLAALKKAYPKLDLSALGKLPKGKALEVRASATVSAAGDRPRPGKKRGAPLGGATLG